MTAFEWCTRIRRALQRGGVASDDSRLSLRYIYAVLNSYRNSNIKYATDFGKDAKLLKYVEQNIACQDLCDTDRSECDSALWGCKVKKLCGIPRFLSLPEHRAITYVGIVDRSAVFLYAEPTDIAVKMKTNIGRMFSYFYIVGTDIYVVPSKQYEDLEIVTVRGVFADPRDADDRINPDLDTADTIDYPMLSTTEDEVIKYVLTELGMTIQTPVDILNNAQDDN